MNTTPVRNFGEFLLPILIGKQQEDGSVKLDRYAGLGFFVNVEGLLATCKHVLQQARQGEVLYVQDQTSGVKAPLIAPVLHPSCDFATAYVNVRRPPKPVPLYGGQQYLGIPVCAVGYNFDRKDGENLRVAARMFRGHVVRHDIEAGFPGTRTLIELSFPVLSGFSGAPALSGPPDTIVGMLHTNARSAIEEFSETSYSDKYGRIEERQSRIVELGLMHSADDVRQFLSDLGMQPHEA